MYSICLGGLLCSVVSVWVSGSDSRDPFVGMFIVDHTVQFETHCNHKWVSLEVPQTAVDWWTFIGVTCGHVVFWFGVWIIWLSAGAQNVLSVCVHICVCLKSMVVFVCCSRSSPCVKPPCQACVCVCVCARQRARAGGGSGCVCLN